MSSTDETESLRALVDRLLAEREMSGRAFSREADKHGYAVSYTTINDVRNGTRDPSAVGPEVLKAIAAVFDLSLSAVQVAAGVPVDDETTEPKLLALHATLTPEEKRAALRIYREYVRSIRGLRAGGEP